MMDALRTFAIFNTSSEVVTYRGRLKLELQLTSQKPRVCSNFGHFPSLYIVEFNNNPSK